MKVALYHTNTDTRRHNHGDNAKQVDMDLHMLDELNVYDVNLFMDLYTNLNVIDEFIVNSCSPVHQQQHFDRNTSTSHC